MKKFTFILISIFVLVSLHAQLGWQIGYINTITKFDNQRFTGYGYEYNPVTGSNAIYETYRDKTYQGGIQGGITYDLMFKNKLSFLHVGLLPAVTYSTSEFDLTDALGNYISTAKIRIYRSTIEIPAELNGMIPMSKNLRVLVFAGPTFSYGINIRANTEGTSSWYSGWNGQRFNLELGGGIGIEYKKKTLKAAYDFGVLKYGSDNTYVDGLKISLGFKI